MWNDAFLTDTAHRPFDVPNGPWIMPQCWEHLLFYHWPVDPAVVADKLPPGIELDTFDGQAWLAIVPFVLSYIPRGLHRWPHWRRFNELNLRTYVRCNDRPGVYFFTLEADDLMSIAVARTVFHLAYQFSRFEVQATEQAVSFAATRRPLWNRITGQQNTPQVALTYGPSQPDITQMPSRLEQFLTERYCFFSADRRGRLYQGTLHHGPWPLQPAWCEVELNTLPEAFGFEGPAQAPLLHYCRKLDVAAWPIQAISP